MFLLSSFVADPLRLHHKYLLLRSLLLLRYLAAKVFLYLQILRSRTPSNSATLNKSETPSVNNFFCYSNDHWHSFSISNAFVLSFELSYSNNQTPMSLKPPLELLPCYSSATPSALLSSSSASKTDSISLSSASLVELLPDSFCFQYDTALLSVSPASISLITLLRSQVSPSESASITPLTLLLLVLPPLLLLLDHKYQLLLVLYRAQLLH